ncbi:hypothetical protein [Nostoc sp.]|uniref:hypothetical protein n=1 Tax=Nostoc sp. TaxID=1180 RepID=UPI002FFB5065
MNANDNHFNGDKAVAVGNRFIPPINMQDKCLHSRTIECSELNCSAVSFNNFFSESVNSIDTSFHSQIQSSLNLLQNGEEEAADSSLFLPFIMIIIFIRCIFYFLEVP